MSQSTDPNPPGQPVPAAGQPNRSQSTAEHRDQAPDSVAVAVLTVSDTRTVETDTSGRLILDGLAGRGHQVVEYRIVRDDVTAIRETLGDWAADPRIAAILTNGGTGIARRDTTYDVVAGLLEKRLDGFGELFRMLSFAEIGAAAMLSRAVAGVYQETLIITMPGSRNAVGLAMNRLILPELPHLVFEVTK
ncbi:MAG: Molybdenum cofactor biosynthesis protein MoaB [uncultured Thermomicrobiales bacterium]|uniref:Molybdenum cofactor biosynthesis protein B n=1 Tax=uncultured Thermomicrobiales bacterium TaxID=1645740 RepID=A0A6J4UBL4_9BACT|nr:MAG: Molybdenum cofactor biosynthesis protein MoaB [uncultured Thermomicrobiales bacterium]